MKTFTGKYASCYVFVDDLEETAKVQIEAFLDCPAFEGAKIRVMPDVHAGAGAVIGFTSTLTPMIIPNVVGVDINCGVYSYKFVLNKDLGRLLDLDNHIRKVVPFGFNVHENAEENLKDVPAEDIALFEKVAEATYQKNRDRVIKSLGTLGGGNHFIELGEGEKGGEYWLTIHSGSRNFGLQIAGFHQNLALTRVGNQKGLEWLTGDDSQTYFDHVVVAEKFADHNRRLMAKRILQHFDLGLDEVEETVKSVHNYIDFEEGVIRKGAISAKEGEPVIIPWNMRDGLIIGRGKGNSEWNYSAPHGAGRVMGRNDAHKRLDLADFQEDMKYVWSSCVSEETLDESPRVYKNPSTILSVLSESVEVVHTIKPIYNFKADEKKRDKKRR
jgi:RNA-splicing ligase RtcB